MRLLFSVAEEGCLWWASFGKRRREVVTLFPEREQSLCSWCPRQPQDADYDESISVSEEISNEKEALVIRRIDESILPNLLWFVGMLSRPLVESP